MCQCVWLEEGTTNVPRLPTTHRGRSYWKFMDDVERTGKRGHEYISQIHFRMMHKLKTNLPGSAILSSHDHPIQSNKTITKLIVTESLRIVAVIAVRCQETAASLVGEGLLALGVLVGFPSPPHGLG